MPFPVAKKRRDSNNLAMTLRGKDKVRIVDKSVDTSPEPFIKFPRLRTSISNGRTLSNIRRGSVRIFSALRGSRASKRTKNIAKIGLIVANSVQRNKAILQQEDHSQ